MKYWKRKAYLSLPLNLASSNVYPRSYKILITLARHNRPPPPPPYRRDPSVTISSPFFHSRQEALKPLSSSPSMSIQALLPKSNYGLHIWRVSAPIGHILEFRRCQTHNNKYEDGDQLGKKTHSDSDTQLSKERVPLQLLSEDGDGAENQSDKREWQGANDSSEELGKRLALCMRGDPGTYRRSSRVSGSVAVALLSAEWRQGPDDEEDVAE